MLLLAIPLLISCGHQHASDAAHAGEHSTLAGLALNGEERWQADLPTSTSMEKLQLLLDEQKAMKENRTVEEYYKLGVAMEAELQQVFKKCTMKGEAHDMLHVYLVPLVEDVKVLKGNDVAAAAEAYARLENRVALYKTYFK